MRNTFNFIGGATKLFFCLTVMALAIIGCQDEYRYDLPDANSKSDTIGPDANFAYASTLEDFKIIKFTNLSTEATEYMWDFGGATSTEVDPTHEFPGEGVYPVTLTATDGLGVSSTTTIDVEVVEGPFQPIILEAGFEDNSLPDGSGDGRDSWRTSIGGVIQITGDPVTFGLQGAKLPAEGDRVGYQEIAVEKGINYDLRFWYTMKNDATNPWVTVAILGVTEFGPFDDRQAAIDGTIASVTVSDDSEPDVYVEQMLSFSAGENDVVAIFFYNGNVEARLDDFTIEVGAAGAVGPSAGFDYTQGETIDNYLEYAFTNTSVDGLSYSWDFGDGNTSDEESPTHVYEEAGTYIVTMTVTAANGLSSSLEQTIVIHAPVTAGFECAPNADDYRNIVFTNASMDAQMLLWEFGDGYQHQGMEVSHTYAEDGVYTVTLTAYSLTGSTDVITKEITVAEGFVPKILEAGFEDNSLPSGDGDGRDSWRNDLGGVIQITGSPVMFGTQAAKLPSDGTRVGYQRVQVEANTDYVLSFYYTMKDDVAGTLTVAVTDNSVLTDLSEVAGATIESVTLSDQSDPNTYVAESIAFNSGSNTEIGILFTNVDVECRIDEFTLE